MKDVKFFIACISALSPSSSPFWLPSFWYLEFNKFWSAGNSFCVKTPPPPHIKIEYSSLFEFSLCLSKKFTIVLPCKGYRVDPLIFSAVITTQLFTSTSSLETEQCRIVRAFQSSHIDGSVCQAPPNNAIPTDFSRSSCPSTNEVVSHKTQEQCLSGTNNCSCV